MVSERDEMSSRTHRCVQVLPVSFIADGTEALGDHHFGKADDGVERCTDFSVCILARNSLAMQAFSAACLALFVLPRCASRRLWLITRGFAAFNTAHRDVERNKTALAHAADCWSALSSPAPGCASAGRYTHIAARRLSEPPVMQKCGWRTGARHMQQHAGAAVCARKDAAHQHGRPLPYLQNCPQLAIFALGIRGSLEAAFFPLPARVSASARIIIVGAE